MPWVNPVGLWRDNALVLLCRNRLLPKQTDDMFGGMNRNAKLEQRAPRTPTHVERVDEGLFRSAFNNSPAMQSVIRASDGVLVEVNDTFLQKLGRSREQVIGKTPIELNSWVDPEKLLEYRELLERQGRVIGYEAQLRASDGRIITGLLSSHRVEINGVPHYVNAGVDITPRKEAEAKLVESERQLRESEARFSTAFKACPVLMNIARLPDGGYVEVNDAFVRWVGRKREEIIGHAWTEFAQWEKPGEQAAFFEELERARSVRNVECRVRLHDGRRSVVLVSAEIIEINHKPHILGFAIDVTEQKKIEQALRDNEARIRSLYESISAAVAVHDENGFLQINSASLKLFGSDNPKEILGKQPDYFSAAKQPNGEDSATAARRHMDRALANGVERFEWLGRRLDGTEFPVEVTLTTVQLEGRQALQAVIIDLTERKRAETELQNALAKERELNQLKSDFVSLVSHEFRTPLEIIMSSADNLDRYHDRLTAEKREQLLRTIKRSVRRMSGMMEEVLVLGRLEADRMTFKPGKFDLRAFCQRMCDEIDAATAKRCRISMKVDGVPERAFGDEGLLRHIFTNLLSNAVKYSAPGEQVDFVVELKGDDAVCRIVDRGYGIPEADQKRLFQAFHRGNNVRQIPGTGLGLLIVQRCVSLHEGEIQFESTEGRGTTFTVRLPLFACGST
jgi:PAS domain S-box-containing protein